MLQLLMPQKSSELAICSSNQIPRCHALKAHSNPTLAFSKLPHSQASRVLSLTKRSHSKKCNGLTRRAQLPSLNITVRGRIWMRHESWVSTNGVVSPWRETCSDCPIASWAAIPDLARILTEWYSSFACAPGVDLASEHERESYSIRRAV
jgi:hypothetical protein